MNFPRHSLDMVGCTDEREDPTAAVQFAVLDPNGRRTAYGDQSWVAHGVCIADGSHPEGRIQYREIAISYGEWKDMP